MKIAIDRTGRVVIPKVIRERLRLEGGETLDIEEHDGVIEMRVAPLEVEIVTVEGGVIARALGVVEPIDDETVRDVLESIRR